MNKAQWYNRHHIGTGTAADRYLALGFRTKAEGVKAYREAREKHERRQAEALAAREAEAAILGRSERYADYIRKKAQQIRGIAGLFPAHTSGITFKAGDELKVTASREKDWDFYGKRYGKRYGKPGILYSYSFTIPKGGCIVRNIDGICTVIQKSREIAGYRVSEGWTVIRGRAYDDISVQKCIVAEQISGELSAHGDTLAEALDDIRKKAKAAARKAQKAARLKNLTMDSIITLADYRTITGACAAGCARFCEARGLTGREKMTVREVLELTEGQYGNHALRRAVTA